MPKYQQDFSCAQEFTSLWRSLYTVFTAAVGQFENDVYINHHNPRLTIPLLVIYLFVVSIIMLNLLIALLTNAQEKVRLQLPCNLLISASCGNDEPRQHSETAYKGACRIDEGTYKELMAAVLFTPLGVCEE